MLPIMGVAGSEENKSVAEREHCSVGAGVRRGPKRKISRDAGRGIEMLAHAIEYLADEVALDCVTGQAEKNSVHPRLAAIELLKMLNREVYLACPVAVTLEQRFRSLTGRVTGRLTGRLMARLTGRFRGLPHAMPPPLLPAARRIR